MYDLDGVAGLLVFEFRKVKRIWGLNKLMGV
jgi:hypothetical protein